MAWHNREECDLPDRYVQAFVRFAAGLVAAGVLLKLLVYSMPAAGAMPVAAKLSAPVAVQAVRGLGATALQCLTGLGLALPLALLFGIPAGLRPGSQTDRFLRAPVALLAGVPSFVLVLLFLGLLSLRTRWLPMDTALYLALVLGVWPWLTLAVRNGLAGARTAKGGVDWLWAGPRTLGEILGHTGNLFLAVMVPGLFFVPSGGLLTLLESGARQGDYLVVYAVLAVLVPPVLLGHLAGDLLGAGRRPAEAPRPSRVWLTLGLLLALVVVLAVALPGNVAPVTAANLQPPGPGHWLGMDAGGRDLARQFGNAARYSLAVGSSAAGVAALGGLVLAIAARYTGEIGASLLTPRVGLPSLMTPVLTGLAVTLLMGKSTMGLTLTLGVVAIPALAYPIRLLLTAGAPNERRTALLGAAGALVLVLVQSLLTEITLGTLSAGLPATVLSLGALTRGALRLASAPHLILPPLLTAVGLAGLSLTGHALVDAAGEPSEEQQVPEEMPPEVDLAAL